MTSQLYFDFSETYAPQSPAVRDAIDKLATEGNHEERGAVFTREEVVDFILDLTGYTTNTPLHQRRLLEPSFGGGDFLLRAIARLLDAWRTNGGENPLDDLLDSVRAIELHRETFLKTRVAVIELLEDKGLSSTDGAALADHWLIQDDYLLALIEGEFDFVVGNPPYVRQELIPDVLMTEYRLRYKTIYDRADLYIPFIERSLLLLSPQGKLGFICSDRWMKNRYGGPLRQMIADRFHLDAYVDMVDTPAFYSEVSAYPAITVISRDRVNSTRIARQPTIASDSLKDLAESLMSPASMRNTHGIHEVGNVTKGAEPWLLDTSDGMVLLRRLEAEHPCIEQAGCKVGIGVATGADRVFIADYATLDVEDDRKLPLATTRDIKSGQVHWNGMGVVNPFKDEGGLVDLDEYPRLGSYLMTHHERLSSRHVARKTPKRWYRTIDRITPSLASKPKLLIPDIKGNAQIVFEEGMLYPHHNLYFITSDEWDLRALQAVLLSGIARLFVATYSTKMRGGFLRFQAQHLRRICIPRWADVAAPLRAELVAAATQLDLSACNAAAVKLYGLSESEQKALGEHI